MEQINGIRTQKEIGSSSWFGFALILEKQLLGKRNEIVKEFARKGIEARPIVAGNFTRNKVIEYMDYEISEPLINADDIHFNGFFVGNHSKNNFAEIDYFYDVLQNVIKKWM